MNKYEILDQIGEGEYGVVLKAKNKQTNELVAIKKFKESDAQEQNKRVILRQVKILKTLKHEHIIELKEAFRKKGKIYLVCQYVEKNLLQILEEGQIIPSCVKQYTYQLLKGIAYMHSLNIIHRDVKPENVLISQRGSVKICDLGFARTMPSNRIMTDYVATRWYRPPQLLIGKDDYDKSIDIWSIGCVMAEMIDGQPLFPGENDLDQLYLVQKCLGPLISQHHEHFLKNPKFIGMKFPDIYNLESIERRYFGKIDKQGLDLLKKMLKMDPKERITPQEALNHPFFQRNGHFNEAETRRGRQNAHADQRHYDNIPSESYNANSNNVINHKVPVNNFMEERVKDDKMCNNKVTGLLKFKNKHTDNISSIRQNMMAREEQSLPKGKSLGNKKVTNIIKDKFGGITDKKVKNIKSRAEGRNKKHFVADMDEYYEQKWDEMDEDDKHLKDKSGVYSKSPIAEESPTKREEFRKSKILTKNYKRDNVNIVFNTNNYNLNLVDPYN